MAIVSNEDKFKEEPATDNDKVVFGSGVATLAVGSALAGAAAPLAIPVLLVAWGLMFFANAGEKDGNT